MSMSLGGAAHLLVGRFGLAGVFAAMVLESTGIPLPSEVTMPLGALWASGRGAGALIAVIGVGTAGNVAGAVLAYAIGAAVSRGWRGTAWLNQTHWDTAHRWFRRRGGGAVFLGRLLPVVRTYISFPAGAARMPLARFLAYTALGSLLWCGALAIAGYALGAAWHRIGPVFAWFTGATVVAIVIAAGLVVWQVRVRAARQREAEPSSEGEGRAATRGRTLQRR